MAKKQTINFPRLDMPLLLSILSRPRNSYSKQKWFADVLECERDAYDNYFLQVGERKDIAFTCHLDTVTCEESEAVIWQPMLGPHGILQADLKADCLGADDGAGVYLLLRMIQAGVPGRYCFFNGEEIGCQGSKASARNYPFWEGFKYMISFDRKLDGVITSQMGKRCCSDTFADTICDRLMRPHTVKQAGIFTDSAVFMQLIPEVTNIGVGYLNEHTEFETLDLNVLADLEEVCVLPETWENLPCVGVNTVNTDDAEDVRLTLRSIAHLSFAEMKQWVKCNPNAAATLCMLISDAQYRQVQMQLVERILDNYGGFECSCMTLIDEQPEDPDFPDDDTPPFVGWDYCEDEHGNDF